MGIDELFDNDILKEIPIVKSVVSAFKIGHYVRERHFIKKLFTFLREYHLNKIPLKELNQFKDKFETDKIYNNKVVEHILVYIDRFIHIEKSKILANLFANHVGGVFDWDYFIQLSDCVENMQYRGLRHLIKIASGGMTTSHVHDEKEAENIRVNYQDLHINESILNLSGAGYEVSEYGHGFCLTDLGENILKYGLHLEIPKIPS